MTVFKRTHKDDKYVTVKAHVHFERIEDTDNAFDFSVWVDFIPETEETPLLIAGVISKEGITIEKNNKATDEATLKRLSEGFNELSI